MIYGQYAKQYANNKNKFSIVSESDAIIDYLFKEQNQYKNLLLTESFFDEEERLVMEAKYQVLQEAVTGVIITAVISVLAILGALLIKFLSMMKQGSSKVKENVKKVSENISKNGEKASKESENDEEQSRKNNNDTKGIIREYRSRIKKLSMEVSNNFKSGKIDIQADWFKIIKNKIEEEFKPDILSDKFKGFCLFDYTSVVNTNAIKKFNDDVRVASTDRDTSNIDQSRLNNTGSNLGIVGYNGETKTQNSINLYNAIIENGYTLLDRSLWNQNINDAGELLINHYNQRSDDSIEYAAQNVNVFLKSEIYDTTMEVIKKMNDDISILKKTLERLKKENFNSKDIAGSKVNFDSLDSQEKIDKAMQKQDDNNYIGEHNRQEFIDNMMYIEQNAVKVFLSFTKTWTELEQYRFKYVNNFNKVFNNHCNKGIIRQVYKEVKMKYGDSFTIDEPYPEYN